MTAEPSEIRRTGTTGIVIAWPGETPLSIPSKKLRNHCPCAECKLQRGEDTHSTPLTPKKSSLLAIVEHTKDEALALEEIWPVGRYALGMRWGDGHDSGIYTYQLLRDIALN